MKSLTNRLNDRFFWGIVITATLIFSSCTIDSVDSTIDEATEADIEAAVQIIGESLSGQSDGILASLNDALAIPSQLGFESSVSSELATPPASAVSGDDEEDKTGRGREQNFSYSFDPETGTHSISFNRSVSITDFSKSLSATLNYIFLDSSGDFIRFPRAQRNRIETIDFEGVRSGSVETPRKKSSFEREDIFLIDGLSGSSRTVSIDGIHKGSGNFEALGAGDRMLQRTYSVQVEFLDVQINKEILRSDDNLQRGVTGTLTYEINITRTASGDTETKEMRGTIELTGDGTALLRFADFSNIFRIKLDDGLVIR
ncbi:MAG: hypothetical protein ACFCU6_01510 [Balneolaceae bacterium]